MATDTPFVRGADKLKARIASVRASLQLPALTQDIGRLLLRRTLVRFDAAVDPDGRPWPKLADSTIAQKRRLGFEGGPLKRTLEMRQSIKLIRGGAGSIFTNTGAGFRIGIQDPDVAVRGAAHNRGTSRLPVRRFLGIGRLDIKAVDSLMRRKAAQLDRGTV